MATKKLSWTFPLREFFILKIESLFIIILALLGFILALASGLTFALVYAVSFLVIYVLVSYLIQKLRQVEENYLLTDTHLHIVRKSKSKTKVEKISLKDIVKHKLDKVFLGGYLITNKGKKHILFFNNKKEVEKFDELINKQLKTKKLTSKTVKKVVKKKATNKRKR